jgi:lipopolysaccharide biosynthesis regulator YciM
MGFFVVLVLVVAIVVAWGALGSRRRKRRQLEEDTPYQRGLGELIAGNRDAALRHLTQAVREDPRNTDAYVRLGNLLREKGQVRQAIQVHRELLLKRRLPAATKNEILKSLALDLAEAKRWEDVIEQVRELPRSERSERPMLLLTRDAYEALGDLDRAVATHRDILKSGGSTREPSLGAYRAHAALVALQKGDRARAKSELQTALKEAPEEVIANIYLGDIAAQEEDAERAIAYWMKVVTDKPECAGRVFDRLEKAYYELGDFGRMMSIYEEVIARAPSNTQALSGLSKMQERKGAIDEAVRTAQEAIKHEGASLAGHRQLIGVLVRNQRFQEAANVANALVSKLAEGTRGQICPSCRRPLPEPAWRCPACRAWINAC